MCGGTLLSNHPAALTTGLSPRVRGNRRLQYRKIKDGRSIPACAGEPCCSRRCQPQCAVYPRVCGEPRIAERLSHASRVYPRVCGGTRFVVLFQEYLKGLSPRVRGNQSPLYIRPNPIGSIPACAGEPSVAATLIRCSRVYPRVCGGTTPSVLMQAWDKGLSPRVRGNPGFTGDYLRSLRSIPACAGEPASSPWRRNPTPVYPRVCGGTGLFICNGCLDPGLSPRVRGNPVSESHEQTRLRSIPACAGEPSGRRRNRARAEVYPRVCGGTRLPSGGRYFRSGLSPRVRGNLIARVLAGLVTGSIPACAGEPPCPYHRDSGNAVYPRVCGGTWTPWGKLFPLCGLSPRVRGNRLRRGQRGAVGGSIPACAGEPIAVRGPSRISAVYPRVCGGTCRASERRGNGIGLSPRVRGNHGATAPFRG